MVQISLGANVKIYFLQVNIMAPMLVEEQLLAQRSQTMPMEGNQN